MKRFQSSLVALSALAVLALVSTPAYAQGGYASSVAIGDGEVYVGESGNTVDPGFVYIYRTGRGGWVEVGRLEAPDAMEADGFGARIALDGDLMLVTAATRAYGVVHAFRRDGGTWVPAGTFPPSEEGVRFGATAIAGNTIVIGATSADDNWGKAYVYTRSGEEWTMSATLMGDRPEPEPEPEPEAEEGDEAAEGDDGDGEAPQPPQPERFGAAVAINGDWLMVGAPDANRRAGLLYVFKRGSDGWERVAKFGDDFSRPGDGLGSAILLTADFAAVGAPSPRGGELGAVRRFALDDSGEWVRGASLFPVEGADFGFGSSIARVGRELYVAAPSTDDGRGAIYQFELDDDDNVRSMRKLGAAGLSRRARFSGSMAVADGLIVAGVPGADFGAGSAVIMTRVYDSWDRARVVSEYRGLEAIAGASVTCTDGRIGRFPCEDVELLSFMPVNEMGGPRGVRTNDIWGWTDPESGRDYALVGMTDRASFVEVTDPLNPVFIGTLEMTDGANSSVWRDIKVHADHAFIVSDGAGVHGVQVFDLRRLREFDGTPMVLTEDAHYDQINSAHNIVINEESAFAFVVGASGGGETCGGGLHMINIEDPQQPIFAGCFADVRTGRRGTGYSHDAQCVTYTGPDERYSGHELCFGSNETALSIADVTDKRNPVPVGMSTYPNVAYTHQGWLTEDHSYFYMNDEGDEAQGLVEGTRTLIWDVRDLEDPIMVGEYVADNKAVDHNLYVDGSTMYQSNYDSGLRIFDVSDPENIAPAGYLDTVPWGEDGAGMGGGSWSNYPFFDDFLVVTSGREGLFVVRKRQTSSAGADASGQ